MIEGLTRRRLRALALPALLVASCITAGPAARAETAEHYKQTNLVSDVAGLALIHDPDLTNAWGMAFSATSPFWISDNGTGKSTLYSVAYSALGAATVAKIPLTVSIPGAGSITGQVFNGAPGFHGDRFIFAGEDGAITGWRPALGGTAETLVAPSDGSVYKGLALVSTSSGPVLLAANFRRGTIDAFDAALTPLGSFADPMAPASFAPFNVQVLGGTIYVAYAMRDPEGHDDVPGPGHGLIDTFNPATGVFTRLITGMAAGGRVRQLDSPWGLALAPATFGRAAGKLLVGNFGSGTILAVDRFTGRSRGLLQDPRDRPIVIDGLWGLAFGNGGAAGRPGTLYFSAGPNGESNGLFGSLDPVLEDHHRR